MTNFDILKNMAYTQPLFVNFRLFLNTLTDILQKLTV